MVLTEEQFNSYMLKCMGAANCTTDDSNPNQTKKDIIMKNWFKPNDGALYLDHA